MSTELIIGATAGITAITQAGLRFLLVRGGWIQQDKTILWERIGALEARILDMQSKQDRTETELHQTAAKLAVAEERISNLDSGYRRVRKERDEAWAELSDLRVENTELRIRLEDALAKTCHRTDCPHREQSQEDSSPPPLSHS